MSVTRLTDDQVAAYKTLADVAGFMDAAIVLPLMVDEILASRREKREGWPAAFLSSFRAWQDYLKGGVNANNRECERLYRQFCEQAFEAAKVLDRVAP